MSIGIKAMIAVLTFTGTALICLGCRSDGPTTRLDYTYDKPIWTDASLEGPGSVKK